ncbi:MAG: FadR family transcriptional regulator [Roseivirga sp.]
MVKELLKNLTEIVIEKPSDKIISQIKDLISSGQLKPGDKLPSERQLSERFMVGRTYVRDAIRKLEFYGIVKTLPQSGTVVSGLGIRALEGLISDVLKMEGSDFGALAETRVLLETKSAYLAALRRTDEDVIAMKDALATYEASVLDGESSTENDLLFHLKIVEAAKNPVLMSLMMIITPDILSFFDKNNVCSGDRPMMALREHHDILRHIENKDAANAEIAMRNHLEELLTFSTKLNSPKP